MAKRPDFSQPEVWEVIMNFVKKGGDPTFDYEYGREEDVTDPEAVYNREVARMDKLGYNIQNAHAKSSYGNTIEF